MKTGTHISLSNLYSYRNNYSYTTHEKIGYLENKCSGVEENRK